MKVPSLVPTLFLLVAAFLILLPIPSESAHADTSTSTVQAQIDAHTQAISTLDQQIAAYQKQLNATTAQKQTLQTAIKSIDLTKAQTTAQLSVTQNKISAANLTLDQLGTMIQTKQATIDQNKQVIASSLREISANDSVSPVIAILSSDTLATAWIAVDQQIALNTALQGHISDLSAEQTQLNDQEQQVYGTKTQLTQLSTTLVTQKGQLAATEAAKQQLLTITKNTESSYQTVIAEKKAQEKVFETDLTSLQNQLKSVTSSEIPHVGQGILAWPFSDAVMNTCPGKASVLGNKYCITQYFGNTSFALANASVYNGMGHDGLDIGVPIGTPVQAALTGVVLGTGNTDANGTAAWVASGGTKGQQCLSFGKWVMIKHANGLDTMYAHLSQISVSKGQAVSTGDVIGYSGMTGYATGPHLHFGVYAGAGVQIMTLGQFRGADTPCQNATMPVSPTNGYLNPLSYL